MKGAAFAVTKSGYEAVDQTTRAGVTPKKFRKIRRSKEAKALDGLLLKLDEQDADAARVKILGDSGRLLIDLVEEKIVKLQEDMQRLKTPSEACSQPTVGDGVNHPAHYTSHPSGIECVEIAEYFNFNIGNAMKYLWRSGLKTPDPKEDLEKSLWYIKRELERLEKAGGK
jgi:hypothetical protein